MHVICSECRVWVWSVVCTLSACMLQFVQRVQCTICTVWTHCELCTVCSLHCQCAQSPLPVCTVFTAQCVQSSVWPAPHPGRRRGERARNMFLAPGKRPGGREAPACCNYAFFCFLFFERVRWKEARTYRCAIWGLRNDNLLNLISIPIWVTIKLEWYSVLSDIPFWATFLFAYPSLGFLADGT